MLTQDDLERERYESRRKAQLDLNTALKEARMEGREEGRMGGEKLGKVEIIHFCERLLQCRETPSADLAALSLEDLSRMADDLETQVRPQR